VRTGEQFLALERNWARQWLVVLADFGPDRAELFAGQRRLKPQRHMSPRAPERRPQWHVQPDNAERGAHPSLSTLALEPRHKEAVLELGDPVVQL